MADTVQTPAHLDADVTEFRPSAPGWLGRGLVWALLVWVVLAVPGNFMSPFDLGPSDIDVASRAVIFAIIGLSLNVLIGYTGTISFGHQAFVGVGAFVSAYIIVDLKMEFWLALPIAAVVGGLQAGILGAVSLRLSGLYFAVVTLAYGVFAQESLFGIVGFTGGDAGKQVPRPIGFDGSSALYFLCLAFLVLVLWMDIRLMRTKAGRALSALRENPRVASSYGINVKAYTLLAFVVSGIFASIGGALLAQEKVLIQPGGFDFRLALIFILMTVIGGLRNRTGIVLGSAAFAMLEDATMVNLLTEIPLLGLLFDYLLNDLLELPAEFFGLVIGPLLLILTITLYPGGIGQQVAPIKEWLLGRRFDPHAGKVEEVQITDVRA